MGFGVADAAVRGWLLCFGMVLVVMARALLLGVVPNNICRVAEGAAPVRTPDASASDNVALEAAFDLISALGA